MIFTNRKEAGQKLAHALETYREDAETVAVGLARGGVVIAGEVARLLSIPLDIVLVRKIGAPGNEELAIGAITEEGAGVFNDELITLLGVSKDYLRKEVERQKEDLRLRKASLLEGQRPVDLSGKVVLLIDDGIATGASMRVATRSMRAKKVKKIVLAIPVAAQASLDLLKGEVDEVVCLSTPTLFQSVGAFYQDFSQVTDEDLRHVGRDRSP